MESNSKSKKAKDEAVKDRISSLPDEIIIQILSLLPTEHAVVTGILARRWRNLWTNVPTLSFCYQNLSNIEDKKSFDRFVKKVLRWCPSKQIQKFSLITYHSKSKQNQSLIDEAIRRNVCELELRLSKFPTFMSTCETLTVLKMFACKKSDFELPTSICFPSLRILSLEFCFASNILSEKLFQSCPALEDLCVKACVGNWKKPNPNFIVSAPVLKRLRFYLYVTGSESECRFVINAPNLEYMVMYNSQVTHFKVEELSSIAESHVDVEHIPKSLKAVKFIRELVCVKSLSLGRRTLRALDQCDPHHLPIFYSLTRLELDGFARYGRKVLPHLLEASPKLKALVLHNVQCTSFSVGGHYVGLGFFGLEGASGASDWSEPQSVPVCLSSSSLELVEINDFFGNKYELNLVKYLLAHSTGLKKLTMMPFKLAGVAPETNIQIYQQVLEKFPRSSTTCQVHFLV